MSAEPVITDEMLTAWMDGELEGAEADRVSRAVSGDRALQERVRALRIDRERLLNELDALLGSAPAVTLTSEPAHAAPAPMGGAWRVAAALVLGLAVGAGGMWLTPRSEAETWVDMAASYQALYVPETLAVVNDTPDQMAAQLKRVSEAVGRDLSGAEQATQIAYRRGQILGYEGAPVIQLAYLSDDGKPVALCLTKSDKGDSVFETSVRYGLQAVEWIDDGYHFVLLGDVDSDTMVAAAMELAGLI